MVPVSAGITATDAQLIAALQRSARSVVRLRRDRSLFAEFRPAGVRKALFRLARRGWLERLERGSYVVLGPGGTRVHSALAVVADWLDGDEYAVTGFAALAHWDLTQHSPSVIDVLLVQPKGDVEYGSTRVHFIRSSPERIGHADAVSVRGARAELRIVGPERALLDAAANRHAVPLYDLADALRRGIRLRRIRPRRLGAEARGASRSAARRLGWLAQRLRLPKVAEQMRPHVGRGGYVPLDPRSPIDAARRDPLWRIYENTVVEV